MRIPSLLILSALTLAACGSEPPQTFAEPALELERLQEATDAQCREERRKYWFCTAKEGFFHLYTMTPEGSRDELVATVMLEQGAAANLEETLLALYGFSPTDLETVRAAGGAQPVRRGGFELALDERWKQPVVRVPGGI